MRKEVLNKVLILSQSCFVYKQVSDVVVKSGGRFLLAAF